MDSKPKKPKYNKAMYKLKVEKFNVEIKQKYSNLRKEYKHLKEKFRILEEEREKTKERNLAIEEKLQEKKTTRR